MRQDIVWVVINFLIFPSSALSPSISFPRIFSKEIRNLVQQMYVK
jgi:hypothetical protein